MHELRELHLALQARLAEVNGQELVTSYGDPLAEYTALTTTAGVMDLSARGRLCLTGADRLRFLNGQVTNNLKDLKPGQGCYAALVTAKGKLESDMNVWVLEDELLLDVEPGLGPVVAGRLEKFIIADDVQIVDAAPHYGLLVVQGPQAQAVVTRLGLPFPGNLSPQHSVSFHDPTLGLIYCMNNPRGPMAAFELFVPVPALGAVFDQLVGAARELGGRCVGWEALESARIEAGIPRFGTDMDATNLAPEAGLEARAISYAKGCYIGQEVIARIRTYGQVARALRGLRLAGSNLPLPRHGDKLLRDGREVGYVTSATLSSRQQVSLALGYVRRECNADGTELTVQTAQGPIAATIVTLPLGPVGGAEGASQGA